MLSLSLAPVYNHNLGTVQRIMNAAMPVGYSETLIKKIFDPPISKVFSRIGEGEADLFVSYHKDIPVGVLCACPQNAAGPLYRQDKPNKKKLVQCEVYVAGVAVLPRFQGRGIGTRLMEWLEGMVAKVNALDASTTGTQHDAKGPRIAESDDAAASVGVMGCPLRITNIILHVWAKNDEAIRFYMEMNYVDTKVIKDYYERIEEPHAVCMEKRLE
ncbi:MAG: hypothetical protein KVP17_004998 [Porospora cf. gigantea B]|uniref:uncharacterized protein n=1 Tax=Porospora cf. gigantea B TaxID=2853592 RepID=UPI003571FB77|nr:MAG: hypothetical protein KVP17_004998 [Porospora cf. gigantea B]